jgi:hypothetical protein
MHQFGPAWDENNLARLLAAFLGLVLVVTLVRSALLARALLKLAALARDVDPNAPRLGPAAPEQAVAAPLLRSADARFAHGWHMAHARVMATKGLAVLTVLVSIAVVCLGAYTTLSIDYVLHPGGTLGLLQGLDMVLTRLAAGLAVAGALTATAVFFEGRLIRRQAVWRLYRDTVADD